MTPTPKTAESDSARAFRDFVRQSAFDLRSVRPWERKTLSSYLGLGNNAARTPAAGPPANPPTRSTPKPSHE